MNSFESEKVDGEGVPAAVGAGRPSDATRGPTARERSRRRKAIYVVAIIALIVVLFSLSYPATIGTSEVKGQPGGVLAQYRDKHGLSQTELGEIDPMSETVHLATLGMRGVGSSLLWLTANEQQMKKDWTQLRATLDQIAKFQPHSVQVWKYQAWNLSYNVSVAFDDYHDKFYWVIEGLNYLLDGIKHNDKEPRLYWDMGWFISNKIGRADEAKYYRRLFSGKKDVPESLADFRHDAARDDADKDYAPDYVKDFRERYMPFSGFPPDKCGDALSLHPDNWHVGKAWFLAAEKKIDPPRYPVRGMADVIFYSDAPTCQFYYADNLEKDGRFDQVAVKAWEQATREWTAFGDSVIDTSDGLKLRLSRLEETEAAVAKAVAELDALVPGERQKLKEEKLAKLKADNRDAWDALQIPEEKRTQQQSALFYEVQEKLDVKDDEVAHRASSPAKLKQANKLADLIQANRTTAQDIKHERNNVNYDFWKIRAEAEASTDCIDGRRAIHEGDEAFTKGDQLRAKPLYEKGMRLWRKVLGPMDPHDPYYSGHPERWQRYVTLRDDPTLGGDLLDVVHRYQKCLDQDDLDLPKPFVLQDIVDRHDRIPGLN